MKCNIVNKKLILYFDKELSKEEMTFIGEHLQSCNSCMKLYQSTSLTYANIETDKNVKVNPFLYTAINQKLLNLDIRHKKQDLRLRWLLKPIYLTIILAFAIVIGINLGNTYYSDSETSVKVEKTSNTDKISPVNLFYPTENDEEISE